MRIKIILMLILSISFTYAQEKSVRLQGVISSNSTDEVSIQNISGEVVATLPVKNNKVKGVVELPKGYYKLQIGDEFTNVYLIPGGDLSFTIDLKEFDESPYDFLPNLVQNESGMFVTKDKLYPLIFALKASKT